MLSGPLIALTGAHTVVPGALVVSPGASCIHFSGLQSNMHVPLEYNVLYNPIICLGDETCVVEWAI